jgi:hypothetical protein
MENIIGTIPDALKNDILPKLQVIKSSEISNQSVAVSAVSAVSANSDNFRAWDSPIPLQNHLQNNACYPTSALGNILGNLVTELSETVQAPLSLIANSVLCAASMVAQAHGNVVLLHGNSIPISLFGITVGESGERKSAIDHYALLPIRDFQKSLSDRQKAEQQHFEIENEAYEISLKNAKTKKGNRTELASAMLAVGKAPLRPLDPLILCSDPTAEGIFKQLVGGLPFIGLFSDEGGLFLGGHGMQEQTKMATLGRLNKLWDGSPFDRVRGGDGVSVLHHRRVSLHLMVQPVIAEKLFADDVANGQGFLARCLVTSPASTAGTRLFVDRNPSDSQAFKNYYNRLFSLMSEPYPTHPNNRQELDPPNILLSDSARQLLIQFHNLIERELASDGKYATVRAFANKSTEHASRIAAVLSIVDATIPLDQVVIEDEMIARAILLTKWYLDEWLSIQSSYKIPEANRLALMLQNWALSDKNPHRTATGTVLVYRSQLGKKAPNSIRKKQVYENALGTLIDHGLCRQVDPMLLDGTLREEVFEIKSC